MPLCTRCRVRMWMRAPPSASACFISSTVCAAPAPYAALCFRGVFRLAYLSPFQVLREGGAQLGSRLEEVFSEKLSQVASTFGGWLKRGVAALGGRPSSLSINATSTASLRHVAMQSFSERAREGTAPHSPEADAPL